MIGCSEPAGRVHQRVERGHAEPDEVRRGREVGLVGDAAARVEAHGARAQPRAQVGGEVARGAVVARHDHGRAAHVAVGERGDQERTQGLRDEGGAALVGQPGGGGIVLEMGEEAAKGHEPGTPNGRAGQRGRPMPFDSRRPGFPRARRRPP